MEYSIDYFVTVAAFHIEMMRLWLDIGWPKAGPTGQRKDGNNLMNGAHYQPADSSRNAWLGGDTHGPWEGFQPG